jgi:uncharacterized membrane protein
MMKKTLKKLFCYLFIFIGHSSAYACPFCHSSISQQVKEGIFNGHFFINIVAMIMPFILFGLSISIIHKYFNKLIIEAFILGGGIAGFFDGIIFHQILQTHHMFSNKLFPDSLINLQINMFWDGIFHAMVLITILAGICLLWKNRDNYLSLVEGRKFYGSLILGFSAFNLIEGILNHAIFQIHHVIQRASPSGQLFWDMTFLIFSAIIFIIMGTYTVKAKNSQ